MGCCDDPPPKPTPAPVAPPVAACPECPDMVIEINDTPDTKDDLVLIKCEHPVHRSKTKCRIQAKACKGGGSTTVVLVNPDGRLRFPNAGDSTKTLSLPADGSWVSFEISGETASAAIGDAVIEAHCKDASGAVKATAKVTVVSFDEVKINIATPGAYTLTATTFTTTGGHAADYSVEARIRPAGVDCTAPQIKDLRIGLQQNVKAGVRRVDTWGPPTAATIAWEAATPKGTSITVPDTILFTLNRPVDANDTDSAADPMYDQPAVATTVDPNSLIAPKGCAGGGTATSFDTPANFGVLAKQVVSVNDPVTGALQAKVTYPLASSTIDNDFTTWTSVFNTVTKEVCALRERTWQVHVSTATAGTQKASAAAADAAASRDPLTGPPFSNAIVNNPVNQTTTRTGSTTFTKP